MMRPRVIPILLVKGTGLYKTRRFKNPVYIGDPINAVKIFNEKEVDELCLLDIEASKNRADPKIELIRDIAGECFMPLCYGGGLKDAETVRAVLSAGVERVVINSATYTKPDLMPKLAESFGRSTLVASMDVKKTWLNQENVMIHGGTDKIPYSPEDWAKELERRGAGEILVNSIDNEGEMSGYNLDLIRRITLSVTVPVIAAGGAGKPQDFVSATELAGASAVAAGSMFVFHGKHRAVLITYPSESETASLWK